MCLRIYSVKRIACGKFIIPFDSQWMARRSITLFYLKNCQVRFGQFIRKRFWQLSACNLSANFEQPFTPRTWLRSASNLQKTHFRWSPTFHDSTDKKINVFRKFRNFRTAVYLPRIALIGLKLGQNAFQTIPNISCFDVEQKKIGEHFRWNVLFLMIFHSFLRS